MFCEICNIQLYLSTGVFPIMACQLITTSKSPFTTFPRALVGFFAWNGKRKKNVSILYQIIRIACINIKIQYKNMYNVIDRYWPNYFANNTNMPGRHLYSKPSNVFFFHFFHNFWGFHSTLCRSAGISADITPYPTRVTDIEFRVQNARKNVFWLKTICFKIFWK